MATNISFACAINCMDGRAQDAVKNYIREKYGVDFVDVVTEPGPCKILAENSNIPVVEDIRKRLAISIERHGSKVVAIAAHAECAGDPCAKEEQIEHLREAKKMVGSFGFNVPVVLLWVPEGWQKAELVE